MLARVSIIEEIITEEGSQALKKDVQKAGEENILHLKDEYE
jgi:hypothetical protein